MPAHESIKSVQGRISTPLFFISVYLGRTHRSAPTIHLTGRGGPVCPPVSDQCVSPAGWFDSQVFFNTVDLPLHLLYIGKMAS